MHGGTEQLVSTSGGSDANTSFAIASVGKAMTAVAVSPSVEAGRLGLDDIFTGHLNAEIYDGLISDGLISDGLIYDGLIYDGLPGLSGTTLRHLLTMTSGLADYYDDAYIEDALAEGDNVQNPENRLNFCV